MSKDPTKPAETKDEWDERGPHCVLCGANMGTIYHKDHGFKLPEGHNYESYVGCTCPKCGQKYYYEEGIVIDLSEAQLNILRKNQVIKVIQRRS